MPTLFISMKNLVNGSPKTLRVMLTKIDEQHLSWPSYDPLAIYDLCYVELRKWFNLR